MTRAKVENNETRLEISSCVQASPLALRAFLDALAELIAEVILEEALQGTPQDGQNTSSATRTSEAS